MALICAITNEVPEQPVVSPASGAVFERRIIEKYLLENGCDPITGKELKADELIEIKVPPIVRPKPPSATSIPAALKTMQDEWDALMLHSFTQRQQLQTARQELSHALYQHDAACRVIARLNKEVAAAREALATLKPQAGILASASASQQAMDVDQASYTTQPVEQTGMTSEIIEKLQEKATVLTEERRNRGRTLPKDLVVPEQIKGFKILASHPGLHSASAPGILALDVCSFNDNKILTGGNDRNATVFNKDTQQIVSVLKGHTKKVTKVIYHPERREEWETVITASPDTTIRIWNVPTSQTKFLLSCHSGPVTGLSLHPTGDYLLSTSSDKHWAFSDIKTGRLVTKVMDINEVGLTTAQFHPDGLIFGTGTDDSQVKIWDVKEQSNVANFPGHTGPISAISFSENGYYLATAADDACVKLWDLRKLKNIRTIQLDEGYEVKDLCFDHSGTYLAIAGTDVRIYLCKQWQELCVFNDHTSLATGVRFGANADYLASTSMDRTVKFYGLDKK